MDGRSEIWGTPDFVDALCPSASIGGGKPPKFSSFDLTNRRISLTELLIRFLIMAVAIAICNRKKTMIMICGFHLSTLGCLLIPRRGFAVESEEAMRRTAERGSTHGDGAQRLCYTSVRSLSAMRIGKIDIRFILCSDV